MPLLRQATIRNKGDGFAIRSVDRSLVLAIALSKLFGCSPSGGNQKYLVPSCLLKHHRKRLAIRRPRSSVDCPRTAGIISRDVDVYRRTLYFACVLIEGKNS